MPWSTRVNFNRSSNTYAAAHKSYTDPAVPQGIRCLSNMLSADFMRRL
ncbi:hypothetical protein SAMN04488004_1575 [Loktanella salsilacus]|uniref:Uncharacterized protein n=1 Tax=Loktanella salsilacus TaxID=195913 RepID=A0A1I4K3I3_9RHOB|nr:hypothetical protein SAMN04488004_1575 [Loktanella salsilacus]